MALHEGFSGSARRIAGGDGRDIPRDVFARLEVYNDGSPEDYIPDVGFADMRRTDYEPYKVVFEQAPPNTPQMTGALLPDVGEPPVRYSDRPMTQGLFEHLMKEEGLNPAGRLDIEPISEAPADPEPMPEDSGLEEIVHGAGPIEESAPQAWFPQHPIAENDQYDHLDWLPVSANYAAVDPQDFFQQQKRIMDNGLGPPEVVPLERGTPMEADFLDQIVLSDPSQQMLQFPEPHIPRYMGPGFGPDVPPAP
jgi:hypothetical protein